MKTNSKSIFCIALFFVSITGCLRNNLMAQDYIPANIEATNSTLLWNEDGSVTVTGTATFTSPIKKYNPNKLINITSNDMLLINPNYYMSSDYTVATTSNSSSSGNFGNRSIYAYSGSLGTQTSFQDPRYFLEVKGNSPSNNTSIKVFKRKALDPDGINYNTVNTQQNNFGFELDNDNWLIFGGKSNNSPENFFIKNMEDLSNFDLKSFGTIGKQIASTDYTKLFNRWRLGSSAWWENAVENNTVKTAAILGGIVYIPALAAETSAASEAFFNNNVGPIISSPGQYATATAERAIIRSDYVNAAVNKSLLNSTTLATVSSLTIMATNQGQINSLSSYSPFNIGNFHQSSNTFINVPHISDYNEIPVTTSTEWIWNFKARKHKCITPTFASTNQGFPNYCQVFSNVPVVAKLNVTDATVRNVSFPGLEKPLTPYQMFRNLKFTPSSQVEVKVLNGNKPQIKLSKVHFGNTQYQELPMHFYNPIGLTTNFQLKFDTSVNNFFEFYLISELNLTGIINLLQNSNQSITPFVKYVDELGNYATLGTKLYKLYKIGTAQKIIKLQLGTDTYLGGDSSILENHLEPANDVVINNDENQAIFINQNGSQVSKAELTINGDVLLYDTKDKQSMEALVGTENFQLYVGSVPVPNAPLDEFGEPQRALGILTENFVIEDRDQFILPDFVFDDNYQRMSLSAYEKFVKENKHLPNVPSQKEVAENNYYSIPKMMMGQLQNLEEIILHTIDQEVELKEQKQEQNILRERLKKIEQKVKSLEKSKYHEN